MKKKSTQVHISQRWALLFLFKWQGSSMWGGNPLKHSVLEKLGFYVGRKPFETVCIGKSELSQARENEVGHLLHTVHKENFKVIMVGAHLSPEYLGG